MPSDATIAATIAASVVLLGAVLVYVRTVGRLEGVLQELSKDVRDINGSVQRIGRRFHWLNNFSMGIASQVHQLCEKAGVSPVRLTGYDFEQEADRDDSDSGRNDDA